MCGHRTDTLRSKTIKHRSAQSNKETESRTLAFFFNFNVAKQSFLRQSRTVSDHFSDQN